MYRRCGFRHERKLRALGISTIAGIDEAGRGALAGPVVAAAVILPEKFRHSRLNDSKQLAPELREEIYQELIANIDIAWAIGVVDHIEIDRINILRASHQAMRIAIAALRAPPQHALIDGLPGLSFSSSADGDHRWRLLQPEHRGRERDRESDARCDDARLLRAFSGILFQPAQRLRHRIAPHQTP